MEINELRVLKNYKKNNKMHTKPKVGISENLKTD